MTHSKPADNRSLTAISPVFRRLAEIPMRELKDEFLRGSTPSEESLAGWEFRGLNRPAVMRYVGIRKFIKGFYTRGNALWGYNSPAFQSADDDGWRAKPDDNSPKRFGFYQVLPIDPTATDNKYLHALLLDYGKGDNPWSDPSRGLRDYLVQIDDDVMLGIPYFALAGKIRLKVPSYFILNRFRRGISDVGELR